MHLDLGCRLDLLLCRRDLQGVWTDPYASQWHKGQMTVNEAFLHSAELGLVCLDVDIDVLKLADLLAVSINEHLAVPLGDAPLGLGVVFLRHAEPPLLFLSAEK